MNGTDAGVGKYTKSELDRLTAELAMDAALQNEGVRQFVGAALDVVPTGFVVYPNCEAILRLATIKRTDVNSKGGQATDSGVATAQQQ